MSYSSDYYTHNESLPSDLFPFVKVYLYDGKRGKRYDSSYQTFRNALINHSNSLIKDNISEPYGNKNGLRLEITPFVVDVGAVNQQGNSDVIHEFTGSSSSSLVVVSDIPTLPYNFKIRVPDDPSVSHDLSENIFKLMGYEHPYHGDLADIEIIVGFNKSIGGEPTLIVNAEEKNEIIFRGLISGINLSENTLRISLVDGMLEATRQEALIGEKITNEIIRFQDRFFSEFDNENRHYNSEPMSEVYGGWDLKQVKKAVEFNLNRLPIIPPARDTNLSTVNIKLQRYDAESQLNKLNYDSNAFDNVMISYDVNTTYKDPDTGDEKEYATGLEDNTPQFPRILSRGDDIFFLEQCKHVEKINQLDERSYKNFSIDYNKGIIKFESPPIREPEGFLLADYTSAYRYKHPSFLAEKLFNQLGYDKKNDGSDLIFEREELDPNYPAGSPDTSSIKKKVISYLGQITPLEDFRKEGITAIHHCETDGMFYYYANKSIWRTDLDLLNERLFSTTYEVLQIDSIYLNDYKQTDSLTDSNYVKSGSIYEQKLEKKLRLVMSYRRPHRYLFTIPPIKGSLSNMPSSDLTNAHIYPMRDFVSNLDEKNFWKEDFTISIGYRDLDGEHVNGVKDDIYFQSDGYLYLKKWDSVNEKFLTDKRICKIPIYFKYEGGVKTTGTFEINNIRKILKKTDPKSESDWDLSAINELITPGNDKKYLMMWSTGYLSTEIKQPVIKTETLWFAQVKWDESSKEITGFVEGKLVDNVLTVDHYEQSNCLTETITEETGVINQEPDPDKLTGTKNTENPDITWGNLLNGINELRYYFNDPNGNTMEKGLEMKEPKFSRRKFGVSGNNSVQEFHIDQHDTVLYRSSTQYYYPYFLGNELTTNFVIDKSKTSGTNSKYDDAYVVAIGCTTHHEYSDSFDYYSRFSDDYIYHPDHGATEFNDTNYSGIDFNSHDINVNSNMQYMFLSYFRLNFISSARNDKIPDVRVVANNAHWKTNNNGNAFITGNSGYSSSLHWHEYLTKSDILDIDEDDSSQGSGYNTKDAVYLLGWNFTTDLMSGLKNKWDDETITTKDYHNTLERFSSSGFKSSSDCFSGVDLCYEDGAVYVLAGNNITKFIRNGEITRFNLGNSKNIFTLDREWGEYKNKDMYDFGSNSISIFSLGFIDESDVTPPNTPFLSDKFIITIVPGGLSQWDDFLKPGDEIILRGIESGSVNMDEEEIDKLLHQTFTIEKIIPSTNTIVTTRTRGDFQIINVSFNGENDLNTLSYANGKALTAKSGKTGRLYATRWMDQSSVSQLFNSDEDGSLPVEVGFNSDSDESASGKDHNNAYSNNPSFQADWGNLKSTQGNYIDSFYWETKRGAYNSNADTLLGGTYGTNPPSRVLYYDAGGDWQHNRVSSSGRDDSWRYWWQTDQMATGSHTFNDGFSSYSELSYRFPSIKGYETSQRLHQQYGLTKMKGKEVFSFVAVNRDYDTFIPNTKSEKERISNRSVGGDKMYSNIKSEVQTDNKDGWVFSPHSFSGDKLNSVQEFNEGLNSVVLMLDLREDENITYYDNFDSSNNLIANKSSGKFSRLRPISSIMPTCMHDAFFKKMDEVTNTYEQFRWVKDSQGKFQPLHKTLEENIGKGYSGYVPQQYTRTASTSGRGDGTWWGDIQMAMTMSGGGHDALNFFKTTATSFQFTPMKSMWIYASRDNSTATHEYGNTDSIAEIFPLGLTHGQYSKVFNTKTGSIYGFKASWSINKFKFGQFNVSWNQFSGAGNRIGQIGPFTNALDRWRRIYANLNLMNTLLPKTSQIVGEDLSYLVGNYGEHHTNTDWLMIPEQFKDFIELRSERGGNTQDNHGSLVFVPKNFYLKDEEVNYFPSQSKGYIHTPDNDRVYKDFLTKPLNIIIKDENEEFNREETHFVCGVSVGTRSLENEQTLSNNKTSSTEKFTQPLMFYRKLEPENFIWTCLSDYLKPRVPVANFKGKSIKDALQELAMIMDYDFGIKNGEPFFEPSFKSHITPYVYYEKTGEPGVIEYYTPRVVASVPNTSDVGNPTTDRKDAMIVPDDITFINGKYFFMSGEVVFIHEKIQNPDPQNIPTDSMIDSLPKTSSMTADDNLKDKKWRYVARNIHNSSVDKDLLASLYSPDFIEEDNGVRRISLLKDILFFEIKMIADDNNIIDITDYGRTYEVQDYTDIHLYYGADKVYKKIINTSGSEDKNFKRIFRKDLPFIENKDWIKYLSKKIQRLIKQEKYKLEFSTKLMPSLKYGDYIAVYNERFNIGKDFEQTNTSNTNSVEKFFNYELFRISNANHNLTNFTTEITAYTVDINTIGINVATINGSNSNIRQIQEGFAS